MNASPLYREYVLTLLELPSVKSCAHGVDSHFVLFFVFDNGGEEGRYTPAIRGISGDPTPVAIKSMHTPVRTRLNNIYRRLHCLGAATLLCGVRQ